MSHTKRYTDMLGYASPTGRTVVRAKDMVAALAPPARGSLALVKDGQGSQHPAKIAVSMIPGAIGGAVGFMTWKKHRVLGIIAGSALVEEGYRFYKGDRKRAICNLAVEGAGILGALQFKSGWGKAFGFIGGAALGLGVTSFIEGTPGAELKDDLKKKWLSK